MSEGLFTDDIEAEIRDALEWENRRTCRSRPPIALVGRSDACVEVVHLLTKKKVWAE